MALTELCHKLVVLPSSLGGHHTCTQRRAPYVSALWMMYHQRHTAYLSRTPTTGLSRTSTLVKSTKAPAWKLQARPAMPATMSNHPHLSTLASVVSKCVLLGMKQPGLGATTVLNSTFSAALRAAQLDSITANTLQAPAACIPPADLVKQCAAIAAAGCWEAGQCTHAAQHAHNT